MQHKHLVTLLQKNFRTVGVEFPTTPNKPYTYKTDIDLAVDDLVVVCVNGKYSIAKVVRVDVRPRIDYDAPFEYKWIVQKVESKAYEARVAHEEQIREELDEVEHMHQRQVALEKILGTLPEGSEARKAFEAISTKLELTHIS